MVSYSAFHASKGQEMKGNNDELCRRLTWIGQRGAIGNYGTLWRARMDAHIRVLTTKFIKNKIKAQL